MAKRMFHIGGLSAEETAQELLDAPSGKIQETVERLLGKRLEQVAREGSLVTHWKLELVDHVAHYHAFENRRDDASPNERIYYDARMAAERAALIAHLTYILTDW